MPAYPLKDLAARIGGELVGTPASSPVIGRVADSATRVALGDLFVAVRGFSADGHNFIDDAFAKGAVAAVVEVESALKGRPGIRVPNTRIALSQLAAMLHGDPSAQLKVVGVTGTNGKTTTNWIIYHVMNQVGGGALRIGTLGSEISGRERVEGSLTSPDAITIQSLLARAVQSGVAGCVMEVSSHALDQARAEHVEFDVGVFTNLTRDHLDYHKTFENYFAAKRHLFELLSAGPKKSKGAVVNIDDEYGRSLHAELKTLGLRDLSFGSREGASFQIVRLHETPQAMQLSVAARELDRVFHIEAPFIGQHNAENLTAAFAACVGLGYSPDKVVESLRSVPQVPGRLERIGTGEKRVFVDYAHTPDALQRAIKALRISTAGELWVVFGCGGDRDRGKRPQMARIAAEGGDRVVVTSDNPRTEKPGAIIADILSEGVSPSIVEEDRRAAIFRAIREAGPSDTILIAGKGHEDYQIIGAEKVPFSDQEVAREALRG